MAGRLTGIAPHSSTFLPGADVTGSPGGIQGALVSWGCAWVWARGGVWMGQGLVLWRHIPAPSMQGLPHQHRLHPLRWVPSVPRDVPVPHGVLRASRHCGVWGRAPTAALTLGHTNLEPAWLQTCPDTTNNNRANCTALPDSFGQLHGSLSREHQRGLAFAPLATVWSTEPCLTPKGTAAQPSTDTRPQDPRRRCPPSALSTSSTSPRR